MKPALLGSLCGAALMVVAVDTQATYQNFKDDVNAAIDAGLAYSRANSYFTTFNYGNGLTLLTLLEKQTIPAGYNGLSAGDKTLAQNAACLLIDDDRFGDRAGYYSYYDGQVLMALSVYLETGGPDQPTGASPYDCTDRSARATIDKVVDRALAAQGQGTPTLYGCAGYWGYDAAGCDSSATQFTIAGLSAAKGYYISIGAGTSTRTTAITTALDLTAAGYVANARQWPYGSSLFDTCPNGCYGHSYHADYSPGQTWGNPSAQQTASGTWAQLLGTGKNVNDATIQRYLRWLQNAYNYNINNYYADWVQAYFYFLWSSSKVYNILEGSSLTPGVGNISSIDMGKLPALTAGDSWVRFANRDPAVDPRPAVRGSTTVGYYSGTPQGWYYDYAYRLMGLQADSGLFSTPYTSWGYTAVEHAYALLVLQRSLGGVFIERCDVDGDNDIDQADLSLISRARGKPASGPADTRDADKDLKITVNDVKVCITKCTRTNCATQVIP